MSPSFRALGPWFPNPGANGWTRSLAWRAGRPSSKMRWWCARMKRSVWPRCWAWISATAKCPTSTGPWSKVRMPLTTRPWGMLVPASDLGCAPSCRCGATASTLPCSPPAPPFEASGFPGRVNGLSAQKPSTPVAHFPSTPTSTRATCSCHSTTPKPCSTAPCKCRGSKSKRRRDGPKRSSQVLSWPC